jgi:DNA-binding response OmpR family regulator
MTKVLIIDDEPFIVQLLETFLQLKGYATVGALNGQDGLILADVEAPDAIILDLMLPDIQGYEVCQRIRRDPSTRRVPILILSGRTDNGSKARAKTCGADSYLVKPVRFSELLAELQRALNWQRTASPAQPAVSAFIGSSRVAARPGVMDPEATQPRRPV